MPNRQNEQPRSHQAVLRFVAPPLLLLVLLTGCATRPDASQPRHSRPAGEIWGTHTVGQTFVAQAPGLHRIDVLLATYARQNTQPVVFHLRESPINTVDLVTISFEASDVQDNAYRTFTFPPLRDSQGKSYYFFLASPDSVPGDAITVWSTSWDMYKEGQMYLAGQPRPGDLAFRTYARYAASQMVHDVAQGLREDLTTALLALLLFLAPGYALLNLLAPQAGPDLLQRLILGAGLSAALAPLLFLFASLVGLKLGPNPVVLFLALSVALAALSILRPRTPWLRAPFSPPLPLSPSPHPPIPSSPHLIPALLLMTIAAISLAVRLLIVQDLVAPMWGDSYHHTLIAQLLADHGGLFRSWGPYAPLSTFTYHFGFHSLVVMFHWLTGLSILRSVIIVGQLLNALAPLMAYPLTIQLGGRPWVGLVATLVASLLSPMPMSYLNWGRYTQLAGMVVLPTALVLAMDALERNGQMWRALVLAGIALAGLGLSHYLISLFYAAFLLTYLGWQTYAALRDRETVWGPWLRVGVIGVVAGLLTLPWSLNVLAGRLPGVLAGRVSSSSGVAYFRGAYNMAGNVTSYVPPVLLILAGIGVVWGLYGCRRDATLLSVWTGWLVLLANPHLVGLPGTGMVNNFMVLLTLYLPLSILAGIGLGSLMDWLVSRVPSATVLVAGLVLAAAGLGAGQRFADLDYRYRLVTAEDQHAMTWIQTHTPPDTRFLVDGFFAFGGHAVVGSDAGWWIPYLARRRNTVPPATYGLERVSDPNYRSQVRALYRQLMEDGLDSPQTLHALQAEGITHVYIGSVGGELLDRQALEQSPYYRLIYADGGVRIFQVTTGSTETSDTTH